ncbi:MAG TPA: hypothetical protein VD788_16230 [Candidatus Polarisedimenticolaceae bacterium]|nr:hypothetical protein [Candidatus Polarisedimenticolaceae bacterium]
MSNKLVVVAAVLVLGFTAGTAQTEPPVPSVGWIADDLNLPLRYGTAVEFAFQYEVHLVGGEDPEGDATLTLELCENHRCTTSTLAPAEGIRFLRYGLDPSQYHRGRNLYTFTLTLTDNGITSDDTLTIQAVVRP